MPKTPFEKISAGLDDAIAYSKGDTTRGRRHDIPINEADRQARAAFRAYCAWRRDEFGVVGPPIEINLRTWERIERGQRDVPPGIARQIADEVREDMLIGRNRDTLEGWAMALEAWAEDCDQRSKRHG